MGGRGKRVYSILAMKQLASFASLGNDAVICSDFTTTYAYTACIDCRVGGMRSSLSGSGPSELASEVVVPERKEETWSAVELKE